MPPGSFCICTSIKYGATERRETICDRCARRKRWGPHQHRECFNLFGFQTERGRVEGIEGEGEGEGDGEGDGQRMDYLKGLVPTVDSGCSRPRLSTAPRGTS